MTAVIGIDAGGTKTSGKLYDGDGNELQQAVTGPGNIVSSGETALENIAKCINELNPGKSHIDLLVLGMAGVTAANKVDEVHDDIAVRFPEIAEIQVINDAQLGMAAALQGQDGIYVIAGTGSVVMASAGDDVARVGGMGHILGDEGAGYWIGKQLFMKLASDFNHNSFSNLSKQFLAKEHTEPEDTPKLAGKFYTLSKDDVASYALFVNEQCKLGDPDACEILNTAGKDLANQVKLAAAKLGNRVNRVATSGSVITNNKVVRSAFEKNLPGFEMITEESSPEKAAYFIYRASK